MLYDEIKEENLRFSSFISSYNMQNRIYLVSAMFEATSDRCQRLTIRSPLIIIKVNVLTTKIENALFFLTTF